jgi:hypothetical protein
MKLIPRIQATHRGPGLGVCSGALVCHSGERITNLRLSGEMNLPSVLKLNTFWTFAERLVDECYQ